jgi:hypothetical protein
MGRSILSWPFEVSDAPPYKNAIRTPSGPTAVSYGHKMFMKTVTGGHGCWSTSGYRRLQGNFLTKIDGIGQLIHCCKSFSLEIISTAFIG